MLSTTAQKGQAGGGEVSPDLRFTGAHSDNPCLVHPQCSQHHQGGTCKCVERARLQGLALLYCSHGCGLPAAQHHPVCRYPMALPLDAHLCANCQQAAEPLQTSGMSFLFSCQAFSRAENKQAEITLPKADFWGLLTLMQLEGQVSTWQSQPMLVAFLSIWWVAPGCWSAFLTVRDL